jgi:chromosome segregation ATPase
LIIKREKVVNKKISKYLFILTALVTFIGLLNSGCSLNKIYFWKSKSNSSRSISKEERMDMLEEKVSTLSYSLGSLTTENYELKKNFSELEAVKNQLTKEYTQIKNKQAALEKAQASDNIARNRLKGELAKTKVVLEKIKQHLVEMESEKNNLKAELEILEATREAEEIVDETAKIKAEKIKQHLAEMESEQNDLKVKLEILEATREAEEIADKAAKIKAEKSNTDQNKKGLIKATQEKRKSSLVEGLLDEAIHLYREERFEDAIAKWEEILALDPGKLEAKFNIEIAQDRIKEKQIQKGLESTRIQRNR